MITNAINKIAEMALKNQKKDFIEHKGKEYKLVNDSYKELEKLEMCKPGEIEINSLSGIVSWLESNENDRNEEFIIVIASEEEVFLIRKRDKFEARAMIVKATAIPGSFEFNQYKDQKDFIINVHSSFVKDVEKTELIKQCSAVKNEGITTSVDDGISQKVTVSDGPRVAEKTAKAFFSLAPYRTFSEVEQPRSTYLLRLDTRGVDKDKKVVCALFASKDKTWKNEAIASIKKYFKENIKSDKVSIIG